MVILHESKRHDKVKVLKRPYSRDERKKIAPNFGVDHIPEGGFFNTMFTGIITHLGRISKKTDSVLTITADRSFLSKIQKGVSVSIDGICLTVVNAKGKYFKVDFMPETKNRTNIKYLQPADPVNLELPATATTFFSGHIVQGHIDSVAKLKVVAEKGNSYILKFSIPNTFSKYIVEKGSIAVNGIALTVISTESSSFTVGIIPYTWDNTMLHSLKPGDFVNIEVSVLAKYVENLLKKGG